MPTLLRRVTADVYGCAQPHLATGAGHRSALPFPPSRSPLADATRRRPAHRQRQTPATAIAAAGIGGVSGGSGRRRQIRCASPQPRKAATVVPPPPSSRITVPAAACPARPKRPPPSSPPPAKNAATAAAPLSPKRLPTAATAPPHPPLITVAAAAAATVVQNIPRKRGGRRCPVIVADVVTVAAAAAAAAVARRRPRDCRHRPRRHHRPVPAQAPTVPQPPAKYPPAGESRHCLPPDPTAGKRSPPSKRTGGEVGGGLGEQTRRCQKKGRGADAAPARTPSTGPTRQQRQPVTFEPGAALGAAITK